MLAVHQFCFDEDKKPEIGKNILESHAPVVQIGVNGAPGTRFRINNGSIIELGQWGVYELDLYTNNLGRIISFTIEEYNFTAVSKLLIDIIYYKGEEE